MKAKSNRNSLIFSQKNSSFGNTVKAMSKAFRDSQGGSPMDRFEEISKLLFCKLYDEEFCNNALFSKLNRNLSYDEIFSEIDALFQKAIRENPNVFINDRGKLSSDKKAVSEISLLLKDCILSGISADIKGNIYEELVKNTLDKNENQQFFTPRKIVNYIVQLIDPAAAEKICDPACGSGGFLISALNHIKNKYPDIDLENYSRNRLTGAEIDSRMVWVAQMNLILHGGSVHSVKYLSGGGSLSTEGDANRILPDNYYDIVITNPPFGSDYDNKDDLSKYVLGSNKKSRRRSILFIEKCIKILKPGGRLAVIIEESVLNSGTTEDVRRFLLDSVDIDAILSLPDSVFLPYATVKTSIIVASKKKATIPQSSPIFMCNIEDADSDVFNREALSSGMRESIRSYHGFTRNREMESDVDGNYFLTDFKEVRENLRLDTLFHHPAKSQAAGILEKTPYPLRSLCDVVTLSNKTIKPQYDCPEEKIRYIGLANIDSYNGTYSVARIEGNKLKSSVKVFEGDSVIYSKMRPELRKVIYIPKGDEGGTVSSECYVFKALPAVLPEYLAIVLRSNLVYGQIVFQTTGLGRPRIGKKELLNVKIPLPPLAKQKQIIAAYDDNELKRKSLLEESEELHRKADRLAKKSLEDLETNLVD